MKRSWSSLFDIEILRGKGKSKETNAKGKSAKADPKGKATHLNIQEKASVIHGLLCKDANMSRDEVTSILREIFPQ